MDTLILMKDLFLASNSIQIATALVIGSLISSTIRYYVKITLVLLISFLVLTIPIPLFALRPRHPENALISGMVAIFFVRLLGIEYEIRGTEHINKANGGIALMNHQSAIDIVVLSRLLQDFRNIVPVVKKELLYAFPFGIGSWLVGVVFIDKKNGASAKQALSNEAVAITKNNLKLAIFPEGTRNGGEKLLPFKKGGFHLAVETQSVIQPVCMSRYHFLDGKKKIFGRGKVIVQIMPEISMKGVDKSQINSLVEELQVKMQAQIDALSVEAKAAN